MQITHGNKQRFAASWELSSDPHGEWLYGNTCFWIAGKMIGEYESETSLRDVVGQLVYPVGDCGDRHTNRFCCMAAQEAFEFVHSGLYSGLQEPSPQVVEEERWARFDVSVKVDVFDDWRLYLFDCDYRSRLLIGRYTPMGYCVFMLEQELDVGEYDTVIRQFQRDLLRLSDPEG